MLKDSRIKNLENLCNSYEKRLQRMAERLTVLAAERNTLYASNKECGRVVDRLRDECEYLTNRLEEAERRVFELEEVE